MGARAGVAITWQLVVGAAIVIGWLALGIAAPLLTSVDPLKQTSLLIVGTRAIPPPFEPGQYGYPLGSDNAGRDIWVEVMYGARVTLSIVFVVLFARLLIGTVLGAVAGWSAGRTVDRVVSALTDAFAAFPTILFALLWIFAFDIRSGIAAFAIALAITGWWGFGRATRSAVVALRGRPFLEAGRALGLSETALFVRHVLPNLLPILAVAAALEASAVLLALGELGFLGIVVGGGFSIPLDDRGLGTTFVFSTAEWGAILAGGRFSVYNAPWIALVPAAAFASAVFGFNMLGHGLRTLFDRTPVPLARILTWRAAAALAAVVVVVRLVTPLIGPAAGYVPISRTFDAGRAQQHIAYFADPAREGRYSGSAGYAASAEYVADRFREIGLTPLGDGGTFFQRFQQVSVRLADTPTLATLGDRAKTYTHRVDFTERVGGRAAGGTAEGAVVYVGGGIQTSEYSDYAGTHPEGNIVLIAGPTQGDPIDTAIRHGARGVIFAQAADAAVGIIKFSTIASFERDTVPVVTVTEAVADELIAGSGKKIGDLRATLEERRRRAQERPSLQRTVPEPLSFDTATRVRLTVPLGPVERVNTMNVVGMLPGTDAERAKKFLIIGGHLDGVGTDPNGAVFPAANDNASGPAVTIEVARVLAANRSMLKNSFIFAVFSGEEEGLIGSEIFAQASTGKPHGPPNVVAFLDLDMTGCCGKLAASDEVFALHDRLKSAADRLGYDLDYTPSVGGSDHVTYLRRRVPAIMIGPTDLGPFHTTGDTVATIDAKQLRASGEIVLQAALEMGASE
ncbi:MAG TPA: M28 family peptidase [Candidatus Limnocylindria bacterium]|nr:M28 family peptidase [Candidatus Limnocylindria bacterium]